MFQWGHKDSSKETSTINFTLRYKKSKRMAFESANKISARSPVVDYRNRVAIVAGAGAVLRLHLVRRHRLQNDLSRDQRSNYLVRTEL